MDNAHAIKPVPSEAAIDHGDVRRSIDSYTSPATEHQTRQHRLLRTRNARFSAQSVQPSVPTATFLAVDLDHASVVHEQQENVSPGMYGIGGVENSSPPLSVHGILGDISHLSRKRFPRHNSQLFVYEDNQSRDLPDLPSPSVERRRTYDHLHAAEIVNTPDRSGEMHLCESSGNKPHGWRSGSSLLRDNPKILRKRKSAPMKPTFDSQGYIDHIESELQQARQDLYSPTTQKSHKEQLKAARTELERLKREVTGMRHTFETEIRRTIEQHAGIEVELKRRVRDLEDELHRKHLAFQDLEHQREEKRLDANIIDTLKETIERLEQDKVALEDENRSMSKRNEVLSELLAHSPTKTQQAVDLKSPTRERKGRPMSMILPRLTSSPPLRARHFVSSNATSPACSYDGVSAFEFPLVGGSSNLRARENYGNGTSHSDLTASPTLGPATAMGNDIACNSTPLSRRSSSPGPWTHALPVSPTGDLATRAPPKRKPRKFMSGSTQLKPLLLPALTGDVSTQNSASGLSPRSGAAHAFPEDPTDPTSSFLTYSDEVQSSFLGRFDHTWSSHESREDESSPDRYETIEEILAQHRSVIDADSPVVGNPTNAVRVPQSDLGDITCEPFPPNAITQLGSDSCFNHQYDDFSSTASSDLRDATLKASRHKAITNTIDIEALSRLELPQARYEALPEPGSTIDQRLLSDVPRPLFTSIEHSKLKAGFDVDNSRPDASPCADVAPTLPALSELSRTSKPGFVDFPTCPYSLSTRMRGRTLESCMAPLQTFTTMQTKSISSRASSTSSRPASQLLSRSRKPLDLLRECHVGARPLAALAIRTLYSTLSHCTSYIQQGPLTIARKIFAKVFLTHWSCLGRLSWWFLGLFFPKLSVRAGQVRASSTSGPAGMAQRIGVSTHQGFSTDILLGRNDAAANMFNYDQERPTLDCYSLEFTDLEGCG